jgi:c-di-GMP-related signal transduction protein
VKEYVNKGFHFCLDNLTYNDELVPLIVLVDYVRLDVQQHGVDGIKEQLARLRPFNCKVISEK